jgi:hypothetical protein
MAAYEPTAAYLGECVSYDPITGTLTWRNRPSLHFSNEARWKQFNTSFAGRPAFNSIDGHGYRNGSLDRRSGIKAHRVILALTTGGWPEHVDHINGDRADNRLSNLRAINHAENQRNLKRPVNNTSGVIGVYHDNRRGGWYAKIKVDQKQIHLGNYDTKEAAIVARGEAELRYGFHKNHGRAS